MFYRQNFLFVGIDLNDDKISECYDQLSNSTLKKFVFVCLSLLKKTFCMRLYGNESAVSDFGNFYNVAHRKA